MSSKPKLAPRAVLRRPDLPDALCAPGVTNLRPDEWFAETGLQPPSPHALAVCKACTERIACLTWALDEHVREGLWGATSEKERETLWRRKSRQKTAERKTSAA